MTTPKLYMFTMHKPEDHHFSENTRIILSLNGFSRFLHNVFFEEEFGHWWPFQSLMDHSLSDEDDKGNITITVRGIGWDGLPHTEYMGLIPVKTFI